MPKSTSKEVPAFTFESKVGTGDWQRAKDYRSSKIGNIAHAAGRFASETLSAGYEVAVKIVEDGTIKVRDYDDD